MKSDLVKKLLRALVTALGIGLGSVLAFVIVQLNAMAGRRAAGAVCGVCAAAGAGRIPDCAAHD